MQTDMHYYGTYAMARAAGLAVHEAKVIAYASQYVDDALAGTSEVHQDGGMFFSIPTAHTNSATVLNALVDQMQQRMVWVPFHFFPGNEGQTVSEKLLCVKDGVLAQEMVRNHVRKAIEVKDEYGLFLLGILAHVYADTFAHYGFSGVSSRKNKVIGDSFELDVENPEVRAYIMNKFSAFLVKYSPRNLIQNYRHLISKTADVATGALGHGTVGTYPDRPFLKWRFIYQDGRDSGWRNNQVTYLEACQKLHRIFSEFALASGLKTEAAVEFSQIEDRVSQILNLEGAMPQRINAWVEAIRTGALFDNKPNEILYYSEHEWERAKRDFEYLSESAQMIAQPVYKFQQAALYHRDYVLKALFPKHGLVII